MIRCEVIFKGSVQGVGFRYTARDMARESGITGWVKNCPDGSVHLLAEGEAVAVEALVGRLKAYFSVRESAVTRSDTTVVHTDFTIEY